MKYRRFLIFMLFLLASLVLFASCGKTEEAINPDEYTFLRFEWNDDHTALALVQKDGETLKKQAQVKKEVLREATEEAVGEARFTASFGKNTETVTSSYRADIVTVKIYAVNDFHGAVTEENDRAGVEKFATYFKMKGEDGNTLLIDSGDTWQGSIYSNHNEGLMLCDLYNYIGVDAKTLGNHEFDWLPEIVARNASHSSYGRTTPFLAANIYDYNSVTGRAGTVQQAQLGKKSVTYTLASGVKVGIVGAIDAGTITSINSLNMMDLSFTDHVAAIKEEATALRANGCDIVICSFHGDESELLGKKLGDYVDLVLCGHSHSLENTYEGNLLFAQFNSNGESFGEITLRCQPEMHLVSAKLHTVYASEVKRTVTEIDPTVHQIVERYSDACRQDAERVVASNVVGRFSGSEQLPNLMARAMYDACLDAGYDVCFTYVNKARTSLSAGTWTYENIFQAFPFDDLVFIAEITGIEILNEVARYNYIYRAPDFTEKIDPAKTYLVGMVDYVFFHTDSSRNFDYFPQTAGKFTASLDKNYRDILRDFLIENGYADGKRLSANDYSSTTWEHDRTLLTK